jgi:hypothetical protein
MPRGVDHPRGASQPRLRAERSTHCVRREGRKMKGGSRAGVADPGADVAGVSPVPGYSQGTLGDSGCHTASALSALFGRCRWNARPRLLGFRPSFRPSASGLGSPLPHLHRDWAHPCHICSGIGDACSASALHSALRHRDWAHPCHICTGTGLTPATSAQAQLKADAVCRRERQRCAAPSQAQRPPALFLA